MNERSHPFILPNMKVRSSLVLSTSASLNPRSRTAIVVIPKVAVIQAAIAGGNWALSQIIMLQALDDRVCVLHRVKLP